MSKVLFQWGIGLFVLFFLVTSPASAADLVRSIVAFLGGVGAGLSDFVGNFA
ncbi:hypothetical protein MXD61_24385 [Frankia sp. AgPm24]|uniref:Secreted protein n=1 Tax=Frankia umida TaxID=573489 RepID=A0ABT0JU87_9ACTN|nr:MULTISPECIES: hypothetical protein [Frankia]MCK9875074.1 hypothetical protein [Frankia umida]MCK9924966.1 hypothetical protein [Frankia sp. AgPm24]